MTNILLRLAHAQACLLEHVAAASLRQIQQSFIATNPTLFQEQSRSVDPGRENPPVSAPPDALPIDSN